MTTITFACSVCGQVLKIGAENAGKRARCVKCGGIVPIPQDSPPAVEKVEPAAAPPALSGPFAVDLDDEPPRRRSGNDYDDGYDDEEPRRRRYVEEEEDSPHRRRRDEDAEAEPIVGTPVQWRRTRTGALFNLLSGVGLAAALAVQLVGYLFFSLLAIEFAQLFSFIANNQRGLVPAPWGGSAARFWLLIAFIIEAIAWMLGFVGYFFHTRGPRQRGVRGLAIALLILASGHIALNFVFKLPYLANPSVIDVPEAVEPRPGPQAERQRQERHQALLRAANALYQQELGPWMAWLGMQLLFAGELILFSLLLRRLAQNAGDRRAARAGILNIVFAFVYAGIRLVGFILFLFTFQQYMRFLAVSLNRPANLRPGEFEALNNALRDALPSVPLIWVNLVLLWIGALVFAMYLFFHIARTGSIRAAAES